MKSHKLIIIGLVFLVTVAMFTLPVDARVVREDRAIRIPASVEELRDSLIEIENQNDRIEFDEAFIGDKISLGILLDRMCEYGHGVESIEEIYSILRMTEDIVKKRLGEELKYVKVYIANEPNSNNFSSTVTVRRDSYALRYLYNIEDSFFEDNDMVYVLEISNFIIFFDILFADDNYKMFLRGHFAHEIGHRILSFDIFVNNLVTGFQNGFSEHEYVTGLKFDFTQYPGLPQRELVIMLGELAAGKISSELVGLDLIQDNYKLIVFDYIENRKVPNSLIEASFRIALGEMLDLQGLNNYLRGIFGDRINDRLVADFKSFFESVRLK